MINDNSALDQIFQLIQQIEDLCFMIGASEEFEKAADDIIMKNIEIISETTFLVSDDFKESHPEIQWSYLAGMKEMLMLNPLVFEPGPGSEWSKLDDYLFDLKLVISAYLKQSK